MSEESKFYTTLQYQDFVDDQDNSRSTTECGTVFAKAVKSGLSRDMSKSGPQYYKYYVRCYPNRNLYDPFPKYSTSDSKQSFVDKVCRPETGYREVTQSIFDKYLSYLRTENAQWLKNAQKELSNSIR